MIADNITVNTIYDKKYNLRLPSKLFGRIEELCDKSERSINEQIVYMLKTWQEPGIMADRITRLEEEVYGQPIKRTSGE
jgi:hypothetical protein